MRATPGRRDRSFVDRAAAGIASAVLAAVGAAADPEIPPSLAAPGDCAQPIRDLDTGPVHAAPPASASRGVAGLPALHFAPIAAPDDSGALLPLDLTRTAQTVDVSGEPVGDIAEGAGALVEGAADSGASLVQDTADAGAAAIGQIGDAAGALVGGADAGAVGDVGETAGGALGDLGAAAGGAIGDLGATSGGALGDVGSAVDPLVDTATDTLGATTEKLLR